jgi:hypothetical protein
VVRADGANDFAAAVVRLLTEPEWARALKPKSKAALHQFAPEQCYAPLLKLIHHVANQMTNLKR